jgi:hypothetical protein
MGPTIVTTVTAPAASADLADLQTVKRELDIADNSSDDVLGRWISSSSGAAARYCNRVFSVETLFEQVYPWHGSYSVVRGERLDPLQLSRWPIASSPCLAGLSAPLAPLLASVAGGALAAARYFVQIAYVTAAGETAASTEVSFSVAANSLLQVPSPPASSFATGWNVYVSTTSGAGTLQNASPIVIGTPWTEPTSGLIAGAAMPGFVAVVENAVPLAEGVDFLIKYDVGQLVRIDSRLFPRCWPSFPVTASYQAGYATIPPDVVEAVVLLVKHRWFARKRDPYLRQENIPGVIESAWWIAQGPGTNGNLPPDVEDMLEKYRVPVVG